MFKKIHTQYLSIILQVIFLNSSIFAQKGDPQFKDVVYAEAGDRKLLLDIYLPAGKPDPYLIVWVHGGAWHSGSKESPPLGLVTEGYALASVDYRTSTEAKFPAQIHDIKAAIRFLRANAASYRFRPDKIIIWGSSAGGHLAALTGVTNNHPELEGTIGTYLNQSSSVQAAIDFYGPTNFLTILNQSTPHGVSVRAPALALLLGKPVEQVPEPARLASPVCHVDKSDPPLFIAHGDQDVQVPINQSHELEGAYRANGLNVEFKVAYGAGHGSSDYYKVEFLKNVASFLAKALKE